MVLLLVVTFSLSLLLLDGCKKKEMTNAEKTDVSGQKVKEKISQAIDTGGNYLAQQKDEAVKKAEQTFSDLKSDTQQLLTALKSETSEKAKAVGADLQDKLDYTDQQLDNLKNAVDDKVKDTQKAFDSAINKLKEAYENAKKEFSESSNSQTG
jgi:vacuolar-type H+-ATPase subunit H